MRGNTLGIDRKKFFGRKSDWGLIEKFRFFWEKIGFLPIKSGEIFGKKSELINIIIW
jgi:hypothetical protein